jgi:hypothetical protein
MSSSEITNTEPDKEQPRPPQKPKTATERVKAASQKFADELLGEVGELASIIIVYGWSEGRTDFPPGNYLHRGSALDLESAVDALDQLQKVESKLTRLIVSAKLEPMDQKAAK